MEQTVNLADTSAAFYAHVGEEEVNAGAIIIDSQPASAGAINRAPTADNAVALEQYLPLIVSNAPIILFALDATGNFMLAQGQGLRAMGFEASELVGTSVFEVYQDIPKILDKLRRALNGEIVTTIDCLGDRVFETELTPLYNTERQVAGVIGVATVITERIAMEEMLRHQMLHDTLTDLPNRTLLLERLEQALKATQSTKAGSALLILDLDRFKDINNTFGHHLGDLILQQVGSRLRRAVEVVEVVGASATIARLGGDEFAILLPDADETSARQVASALNSVLEEPFDVEGYSLQVEASTGIALFPAHGSDALTLLRRADIAMYTAKQVRERYVLYDAIHDQFNPLRLSLIGTLRHAIANDELMLYYQPKAEMKTGAVCSAEALLRWRHPAYGYIPPDQFIPLAEQTGLITPLTRWVLEAAVRECRKLMDADLNLRVSVNLSMWNLREALLPDFIEELLQRFAVPPQYLCLELTESSVMTDLEHTLDVLKRLFALGVHISVDDFGTGYSSLAYLKRLPIDELKIDRSFVQHMSNTQSDATIVQATVTMAHSLGLRVVAEGVEDQETWSLLAALGCDTAQGYYISRPLPAQDFARWLLKTRQSFVS